MSTGRAEASDYEKDFTEPVGQVIKRWVRRSGILHLSDRERIWNAWQEALGADAAHTRLEGLRNHVASVVVDSSALLSELRGFRKQQLLDALRRDVRTCFVRDIRFRLEKRGPPQGGPHEKRNRRQA